MIFAMAARTKLTYKDYVQIPDDGQRHEIIDGEDYVSPAPETYHQRLSGLILHQLMTQIEDRGLGAVYHAPIDIQLSDFDIVQPDLVVVLASRRFIITPKKIKGPPDLVVEILSPSTGSRDQREKLDLYQRAGVPEYWIVDPDEHTVEQRVLKSGKYELVGRHSEAVDFRGLPGVRVDLKRVW